MDFLRDYRDAGGRVVVGSDPGFMYNLHGFGYVRELVRLDDEGRPTRVGGVAWVVKGFFTYDGGRLRAEVREMVTTAKEEAGRGELRHPGWEQ